MVALPGAYLAVVVAGISCAAQSANHDSGISLLRDGLTLLRLQDYSAAVDPLRRACELEPGGEDACYLAGRTLFLLGRYDEAEAPLEAARSRATAEERAKVYRALALNADKLANYAEAERRFLTAIRSFRPSGGTTQDPRLDYGAFLVRQGRAGEALEPLRGSLSARSDSAAANAELGRAFLDLDRPGEALPWLEKAVRIDPRAWSARMLLGKAYLRVGRAEEGQRELSKGRDGWAKEDHGSSTVK
jgi:tetratricopeptide (TPR) repeat protein